MKDCVQSYIRKMAAGLPITKPSIPIFYFGDLPGYQESELKIITVGLNPSHHEFPEADRFTRFKKAENLELFKPLSDEDTRLYVESLNNYFKEEPYNWFNCYEPLLNGLHASYYPNDYSNRALHTDICSPFATDVTWSELSENHQRLLSIEGCTFWHRLVEYLKPDLILISVARNHLLRIRVRKSRWKTYTSIHNMSDGSSRPRPYDVETAEFEVEGKNGYLVFGKAAQLPFGTLSKAYKEIVGERLLSLHYDTSK